MKMAKNYRARPKGWRNDSVRHSLASKGIKTKTQRSTKKTLKELRDIEKKQQSMKVKVKKLNSDQLTDGIIRFEEGSLSPQETIELFSHLVNTGLAFKLQGFYGRVATGMIEAGIIDSSGRILKSEFELIKELEKQTGKNHTQFTEADLAPAIANAGVKVVTGFGTLAPLLGLAIALRTARDVSK